MFTLEYSQLKEFKELQEIEAKVILPGFFFVDLDFLVILFWRQVAQRRACGNSQHSKNLSITPPIEIISKI